MREIAEFFDKLFFSESVLGDARTDGDDLIVPVGGLFVLAGHPLYENGSGPYEGELVFNEVVSSKKIVTEYIGDSRKPVGFKEPREVVDEISKSRIDDIEAPQEYGFEGYQNSPSAWIDDWVVLAKSFKLVVRPSHSLSS